MILICILLFSTHPNGVSGAFPVCYQAHCSSAIVGVFGAFLRITLEVHGVPICHCPLAQLSLY